MVPLNVTNLNLSTETLQEAYASLTTKTLVFLQLVISQFDAEYIVKVDDDVYLRTERLPYAMAQWSKHGAGGPICVRITMVKSVGYFVAGFAALRESCE